MAVKRPVFIEHIHVLCSFSRYKKIGAPLNGRFELAEGGVGFSFACLTVPISGHHTWDVPRIWGLTEFSDSINTIAFSSTAP